jgi:phosphate starvation-inducible PhoH-like protein
MGETTEVMNFDLAKPLSALCGVDDQHLQILGEGLQVAIQGRGNTLSLTGDPVDVTVAVDALRQLYDLAKEGHALYPADIRRSTEIVTSGQRLADVFLDTVLVVSGRRRIAPKNLNQKLYIDAIRGHDLTFGIGPAGTGKTYLAMALAVSALANHEVKRIVLTRPAVEAGERLGFLPGDMADKVNPYLRPLYDALYDMMDAGRVQRLMADEVIEVAPLAFMRGRTLNDCFVILDEAQNTTREQMKMFLTRLGFNARAVVTGDVTQTDLVHGAVSGLVHARSILRGTEGIAFADFEPGDVVRHPLVMRIVRAYEQNDGRPTSPTAPTAVSADDD